ncbi:hypothetical protein D3C81_997150 [compost metagenome]
MPIPAIFLELAFALHQVRDRERHTHLFVQGERNAGADLEAVANAYFARCLDRRVGADVVERLFHVVRVGQAAEQHRRIERLDQGDPRRNRPDAVTGRQGFRHGQVGVIGHPNQLDAERVFAGRRLDAQGHYGIRRVGRFVEELVGDTEVDVAYGRVFLDGVFGRDVCGAAIAATGLVRGLTVDHRHVQVELPAIVEVVATGEVKRPGVGLDPVQVDSAQEDRVQGEKTVEDQLAGIVAGVGYPGFDAELATAEKPAGLVIQVRNALRRLRVIGQRLSIRAAAASGGCGCGAGADAWITLEIRGRLGQAFGRGRSGLLFDLADPLFENRQGFLLYFVSLFQLQELLFESLQFRVRCCLQHRRRE